jgi:hypothetical protein
LTDPWGVRYFGDPWPSGICDEGEQVPTPVGQRCLLCGQEIQDGDRGSFMGDWRTGEDGEIYASVEPVHRECSLRSVLGSYVHLTMGEHPVGACNEVDSGMTYREDALLVWEWVQVHGWPATR